MASDDRQLPEERIGKRKTEKDETLENVTPERERENVVNRIGFVGVFSSGVL